MEIENFVQLAEQIKADEEKISVDGTEKVKFLVGAKEKVQNLIDVLKKIEKKTKKTKQSRKFMKILESFVACHITNPAIIDKYSEIVTVLSKYYKGKLDE